MITVPHKIIGNSAGFKEAIFLAKKVAKISSNIFISGESGTGKEVITQLIHNESLRHNGPLVVINCSAIPEALLESELFGQTKGAFTGAEIKKVGMFEEAHNGTLFLDEIADLSLCLQAKILRVIQDKKIKRVGENHYRSIDCQIISATHKDLAHCLFHKNVQRKKNPIQVFDQTLIKKITETTQSVKIELENGELVKCKYLVYCTGFQTTEILKEKIADLFDTYAVISEQQIDLPVNLRKTLVWDTNSPYLYMRCTEDKRLLIGGEDSSFRMSLIREKMKEKRSKNLMESLKDIAPSINFTEDFTWAGTFGQTKDGLPYIGKSPEFKRSYFVLGYGGNGITYSVQAMKLIPKMIRGEKTKLGFYYRFGR